MTDALLPSTTEVFNSCYNMEGAVLRWIDRRGSGLTDDALREALAYEFGITGGSNRSGRFIDYRGGADPAVWYDEWYDEDDSEPNVGRSQPSKKRHAWKGSALLAVVRRVLRIRPPVLPGQQQKLI